MNLHGQRSVRAASVAAAAIGRSGLPRVLPSDVHLGVTKHLKRHKTIQNHRKGVISMVKYIYNARTTTKRHQRKRTARLRR